MLVGAAQVRVLLLNCNPVTGAEGTGALSTAETGAVFPPLFVAVTITR